MLTSMAFSLEKGSSLVQHVQYVSAGQIGMLIIRNPNTACMACQVALLHHQCCVDVLWSRTEVAALASLSSSLSLEPYWQLQLYSKAKGKQCRTTALHPVLSLSHRRRDCGELTRVKGQADVSPKFCG